MKPQRMIGSLDAEDLARLDGVLEEFLRQTDARAALLLDRSGQMLTRAGETADLDATTFASLAAADFAASDQLALLLGEDEFSTLYHHGADGSMYLVDVAGWAILAALFGSGTTLGLVRLKTRRTVPEIASLFDELAAKPRDGSASIDLEADWLGQAEDEIDRLFAE